MAKKATIEMVSKTAGVSRGTVDRVINGRSYVKTEVKERVVQAMKALGYMPLRIEQAQRLGLSQGTLSAYKLGVLLPNWTGHFKNEALRGIADATRLLKDYEIQVVVAESETDLPDEIVEHLAHLKEMGVKGIAMCAKDHKTIIEYIDDLFACDIPVVTFNSDIAESKRICFVGENILQGGRVAGELMLKYLNQGDKLAIAVGNPEFSSHKQRLEGFLQRMNQSGFDRENMQIVKTYNDYTLTFEKISEILRKDEAIKGIYMANRSTTACVEAVRTAALNHKIHIIAHDITNESKRLVRNNEIDFILAQNIYYQGYRPLIILKEYLKGNNPLNFANEKTPVEIICAENLVD